MGKKSKLKKIRKIAGNLPVINAGRVHGEKVTGAELYKEGMKEVNGKPIDPDKDYRKKTMVDAPLNHNRKMKKLYNQFGAKGVGMYVAAVQAHVANQKKAV